MKQVSTTKEAGPAVSALTRAELLMGSLSAAAAAIGYYLGSHLVEYVAVLLAVSAWSLVVARALEAQSVPRLGPPSRPRGTRPNPVVQDPDLIRAESAGERRR